MAARQQSFRPGPALTWQAAVALLVVIALAAWQFSRAMEKTALRDARAARLAAAPTSASTYTEATADFTRLRLQGRYDAERQFLVADGRYVSVFTPLETDFGVFLVNRGQIPRAATVTTPEGWVDGVGVVWPSPQLTEWTRGERWPERWPKTLRWTNPVRMAALVDAHPRELRLEAGSGGVLTPAPLSWDHSPGMHWGYVVQWLLIGAAIIVGYVLVGRRRGGRT